MNRLVIIGNGFDLAHGLKTSYQDFFGWYWDDLVVKNLMSSTNTIVDLLCKVSINKDCGFNSWCSIFSSNWILPWKLTTRDTLQPSIIDLVEPIMPQGI